METNQISQTLPDPQKEKLFSPTVSCARDLRFILTQDCNYNCGFCHKERMTGNEEICMDMLDYGFLYKTAKDVIPMQGVTLTGGEPLMRRDTPEIIQELKYQNAFVTMISNGSLLRKHIDTVGQLDRLNISLHTTNQALYETITGTRSSVDNVMRHITLLKEKYPNLDLRLNSTLLNKSTTTMKEINTMLDFVKNNELTIKYLELTPRHARGYMPTDTLIPILEKKGFTLEKNERDQAVYSWRGARVMLRKSICSLVEDLHLDQNYCKLNNDINVSPDGFISPCLLDQKKFGIYNLVRDRDDELLGMVLKNSVMNTTYKCCMK